MSKAKPETDKLVRESKAPRRRIAARKRAEENLRRMATVVRDSNDAITIQDFEGRVTAWNRGAELMYGYSEEEALQKNIWLLTPANREQEQRDFTRRLMAGEAITSLETQRVTKDGRILDVWLTVTKLMDDAGKPIGIASTERDITERKKEEANLRRMATVVRDSNDAITIQDVEGRITAWNRGAELMFGYSEPEALTMTVWQLAPPSKAAEQRDFNRRLFAGEPVTSFETQRLTKNGRLLDVWLTVTKLVDDSGKTIGIAATERDITQRKRAEEELRKLNAELEQRVVERTTQLEAANNELEAFSYSVSHDLRAPLRHVAGYVDMLAREAEGRLSEDGRHYMKTIADASREMGQLIDDLLAFSRMGRAEVREVEVNLDMLVQETLRDVAPDAGERNIVWKIPPLPAVQADPALLKLALANLLGNAVKFTRPRDPAQIEIGSAGTETGRLILFVRDNGVGFDPQYAHKLFGVFQRLHRADEFEGTGIGLANVRRIIARHGGRTWAEGKLDEGATFYFTLKPSTSTSPGN
jgi:PAS domain S-box-containing protein